jgi:hypothetical protein
VSLPSAGDETLPSTVADPERTALVRARFGSYAGLGLSFWFIIAILAMEIPAALLQPCNP